MTPISLQDLNHHTKGLFPGAFAGAVAGYLGAISYRGETVKHAAGVANLNTGAPMTTDTQWLLGSITKVMTASMMMRLVDQGRLDLDRRVVDYLPEFRLKSPGAAEKILVRQLLDHTSGLDADALGPSRDFGPRMVETYVEALQERDLLFEPGVFTHYSNPGYGVAGRIIERLEGITYHAALERDLFGPLGMTGASTSAEKAILGPTAIGAFAGGPGGALRPTSMFSLPGSMGPGGSTPIVTLDDVIAFGRMHLDGGVAHDGSRYLSTDAVALMRRVAFDLETPNSAPTGLGWRIVPLCGTTALFHSGGSPGGASSFLVLPEHDLMIAGFATGPGAGLFFDHVIAVVLKALLGLEPTSPFKAGPPPDDLSRFEGRYAHFQNSLEIRAVDGRLEGQLTILPVDEDHRRGFTGYMGADPTLSAPKPYALEPINETLFKPAGAPDETFYGVWGRVYLSSFHQPDASGRPLFHHSAWRASRRVS